MIQTIKHYIKKAIGLKDYWWYQNTFENLINPETLVRRKEILAWAQEQKDPVIRQGFKLRDKVLNDFKNKLSHLSHERILIHTPHWKMSPAGYSLFTNMKESFNYLGIPADEFAWDEDVSVALKRFKPTILLSGDHKVYLDRIDWKSIEEYRRNNTLKVGLTASLEEYGNTPLLERLAVGKTRNIDFYYSYREEEYLKSRKEYKPFFDGNHPIFSIPFGANPLIHYPVPGITKDIDYTFIASVNKTKAPRYLKYMGTIVKKYKGFIDGPGWKNISDFTFDRNRDRYIYARSKVGLNIHLEEQIEWACETSERTYQLAACGIPQVTDHAKIFDTLFSKGALFIADNPTQYTKHFEYIINNPETAQKYALIAQKEVFEKYTTFHRAEKFVTMLSNHFKK